MLHWPYRYWLGSWDSNRNALEQERLVDPCQNGKLGRIVLLRQKKVQLFLSRRLGPTCFESSGYLTYRFRTESDHVSLLGDLIHYCSMKHHLIFYRYSLAFSIDKT